MNVLGYSRSGRLKAGLQAGVAIFFATLVAADEVELSPKVGRGAPPLNARGAGPWATRVMLATSTNGLDFNRLHFVLSDQAGVPNVVEDNDGLARVYYIDYGNGNVIAAATQKDKRSLTNWSFRRVRISGLPDHGSDPVDPTVVTLPPNRYRLYFMQGRPRPTIYSAISTNGYDFTAEPGARFTGGSGMPEPVFDPTVIKIRDEWRLWCGPDGRFNAKSKDGLNFTSEGAFHVEGSSFMTWSAAALPAGKGYRLYGNFHGPGEWSGGVSSVSSSNGLTWRRDEGVRLSLGRSKYSLEGSLLPDNGCALLSDSKWLMAYLATIPEPRK